VKALRLKFTRKGGASALVALTLIIGGGNLLASWDEVHAYQASQHREEVAQHQQDVTVEGKLCSTFGKLAALKPPAGSPAGNPSRAFEQSLHSTLVELGVDLGCRLP
jgi:hypothetical protein